MYAAFLGPSNTVSSVDSAASRRLLCLHRFAAGELSLAGLLERERARQDLPRAL